MSKRIPNILRSERWRGVASSAHRNVDDAKGERIRHCRMTIQGGVALPLLQLKIGLEGDAMRER